MSILKDMSIDIQCSSEICKKKNNFKVNLNQVKNEELVLCPHCGAEIQLRTEEDDLAKIDKSFNDLSKSLDNLGGNIVIS